MARVINVVSMSTGKDSVATWLMMRRTGLDPVPVYVDTLWEWQGLPAYLALLQQLIGPVRGIAPAVGFAERVRKGGIFPRRDARWCTPELKLAPFAAELDRIREETGDEVTVFVGVRREESDDRARMVPREWMDLYDCYVERPILDWTLEQVIAEHHLANVPLNPLYHLGFDRVGCFPCIQESKNGIALVAEIQPSRIDEIEVMEEATGGTMFALEETALERRRRKAAPDEPRKVIPTPIREVVAWARTSRGGKQLQLVLEPAGGCPKWGICDVPKRGDK